MRIIWYNRDSISDVEMRQAKEVANRLMGKEASPAPAGFGFDGIPYWLDRAGNIASTYGGIARGRGI
jgi:hypothetical protein